MEINKMEINNREASETVLNKMKLEFDSVSENEGFARVAVAAFMTQLNPTLEEVADVKTAVSEAVTNAIIHGYEQKAGTIVLECVLRKVEMGESGHNKLESGYQKEIEITIEDFGMGIENVKQAMEPLYTSKPELERSGMGFAFMEAFMDRLTVESIPGTGTKVHMKKIIGESQEGME